MKLPRVSSPEDLIALIEKLGFLPYFAGDIPGFSLEECIEPRYWFSGEEGAWEWKGPVIQKCGCAYGKFFGGKAGFISRGWFPDFANYRRQGYDLDALYDDGFAKRDDLELWQILVNRGPLLSLELKELGNYVKGGKKGFEGTITRLQMNGYVVIRDFEYRRDKLGRPYGWGITRYDTPENLLGADFTGMVYERTPAQSEELLWGQLMSVVSDRYADQVEALLTKGRVAAYR